MKRVHLVPHLVLLAGALALVGLVGLVGCDTDGDQDRDRDRIINVDGDGYTTIDMTALDDWLSTMPSPPLSAAETTALLLAREEEKLARDAFRVFDQQYDPTAFTKIAASEQTHFSAVGMLLDKYGLADPVTNDATGVFTNADLLALYQAFVAQGDASVNEALTAGTAIQEMSVVDLRGWLADVDNDDVECVFENLQKGSRNHIRALVRVLDNRGVLYVPQYLTPAEFDAIVDSAFEQGTAC